MMTGELATVRAVDTTTDGHDRMAALFDAHHRRLYGLARRLTSNAEDARDLVQETFLRAASAVSRIPPGTNKEEAWLVRVLINLCRDRWRRRRTARSYLERNGQPADRSPHPEAALLARSEVWRAMASLPPRRRAVVVMHELEELSHRDIARLLGIAAVTVRWHLSRGRRQLADVLKKGQEP